MFRKQGSPVTARFDVPERPVVAVRTLVIAALLVLGILALASILSAVLGIVLLFLIAIVFAEGIRPLVVRIQHMKLPLPLAILVVYVLLIALLSGLVALLVQPLVSQAQALASNFPHYAQDMQHGLNSVQTRFHLSSDLGGQIENALNVAKDILFQIGQYIVHLLVDFVVVLLLGFLWLTTSERLKNFVVDLIPPPHQLLARDVIREMGFRMGGYLRAVAINMVVIGILVGFASATFLHLPSPLLLAIFAGLTEAIPILGPFLGAIPAILLGFTVGPFYPLWTAITFLVIQQIESNTLVPVVMNRVVALPALSVVLALLIGGALEGITGALLAVPLAAAVQVVVIRVVVPYVHRAQGRPSIEDAELVG